jgi:hypothetical protein
VAVPLLEHLLLRHLQIIYDINLLVLQRAFSRLYLYRALV